MKKSVLTAGLLASLLSTSACTPSPKCDFAYVGSLLEREAGYTDITKSIDAKRWESFAASLPGLKRVYRGGSEGPTAVWLGWDELAKDIGGVPPQALEDNSAARARLAVRSDEKGWFRFDQERPFTSYITVEFTRNGTTVRDWTPEIFATNHCVVAIRFRVEGGEEAKAWPGVFDAANRIRASILAHEGPTT